MRGLAIRRLIVVGALLALSYATPKAVVAKAAAAAKGQ
jgi:hypothetical protein